MLPADGIVSREDARRMGFTSYFTGEPCSNGHVFRRNVKTGKCNRCVYEKPSTRRKREKREEIRKTLSFLKRGRRTCSDCNAGISQRHAVAQRCVTCAKRRTYALTRARLLQRLPPIKLPRHCKTCGVDVGDRGARASYCDRCIKQRRRDHARQSWSSKKWKIISPEWAANKRDKSARISAAAEFVYGAAPSLPPKPRRGFGGRAYGSDLWQRVQAANPRASQQHLIELYMDIRDYVERPIQLKRAKKIHAAKPEVRVKENAAVRERYVKRMSAYYALRELGLVT